MFDRLGFLGSLFLLFAVSFIAGASGVLAKTPHLPVHGAAVREHRVATEDGADLSLIELEGNDGADVVLIQPGLIETAETFDHAAAYFKSQGFKVMVLQSRYVGRGRFRSRLSPTGDNGLESVLLKDPTAAWRFIADRLPPGRKMHIVGHSKGGMQILAMLNQPALAAEFAPHIGSATLLTAPDRIEGLDWYVGLISRRLIPWLENLHSRGVSTIDFHHDIFEQLKTVKDWGMLGRVAARLVERPVAYIAHEVMVGILLSRFTSSRESRRLMRQEISVFPVKLLLDFAHVVVDGHLPVPMSGEALTVPTQIFTAEYDRLVRRWHQAELFQNLINVPQTADGVLLRRWVNMEDAHHVDPAVSKRLNAVMLPLMAEFMRDPAAAARRAQGLEITSQQVEAVTREQCRLILEPAARQRPLHFSPGA
jgi:alpha-beta hydrolase superfamily lysophospholipase